jgi:hypothetical protein
MNATTIERLIKSPGFVAQALTEQNAKIQEQREAAADAITELQAKRDAEIPIAKGALAAAKSEYNAALAVMREASAKLNKAHAEVSAISVRYSGACQKHETLLKETANPAIEELLREIYGAKVTPARASAAHSLREELWREPLTDTEIESRLEEIREQCGLEAANA